MPGLDRTGPAGAGPMTGGARGCCHPAEAGKIPAFEGGYGYGRGLGLMRGFRGGFGQGRGRGRGFGRGYGGYYHPAGPVHPTDAASEKDMLKANAEHMQKSLDAINQRIDELSNEPAEGS